MRPAQVLPHEVRELMARLPRWHGPFIDWAVGFSNRGSRWLPGPVRRLPLHLAVGVTMVYAKGWL